MDTIDDTAINALIAQGLSQRAIAEQLNIPRSTLRQHLEKQKGKPQVYHEFPFADELTRSWGEIQEVLDWFRERKQFLALALDTTRKRRRQTYHVEERGMRLRRDTVIPQWFQASKAAAASDGHAVHC